MDYILNKSPNLMVFTGAFTDIYSTNGIGLHVGVVTKNINGRTLCAIIGYADFKVTNINFRSYIFFGLRILVRK